MRKSILAICAALLMCTSGVVFAATGVRALFYAPDAEVSAPLVATPQPSSQAEYNPQKSLPFRLRIPSIGIDAKVQHVGVNDKGNMANPNNFTDVAWYKYGPVPGASGSAVIAGHLDNGLGLPAVFKKLEEVQVGDDIFVEAEDGSTLRFVVTSARTYPYTEVPTAVVFNPSGSVRLNLITCAGTWLKDKKTYDERLVVFAKPAEE